MVLQANPAPLAPVQSDARDHDSIVVLRHASWGDFQRVLEMRGDRATPRIAFVEGALELMSPSRSHEHIKSMIGCLVEAWCMHRGVDITPYGSWTLENKEALRGLEPDECYVVGTESEPERPDLAIEVVWTSGGIDKLDIYRPLGVGEVWIWQDQALRVFVLRGGQYELVPASELLVGIDLAQLLRFIDITPMTRAVREYRSAL